MSFSVEKKKLVKLQFEKMKRRNKKTTNGYNSTGLGKKINKK